ncbi:flagellar brake protein [Actimicrobium sp. CCC2.4]|uniref:flagellar brake protein n=1 Tax=Actimicrobium sp. CCC2.4 TaxID=3048606 RepID=UPI002AC961BF|nr:flagellar brake protein [Actimicrobium sp. CCC2.4]MEB0136415.1 flagellar brake protein [Actimicrobium sp. CCC2.4]WPX31234.1 flagellar brake protein [Actimicrobium sp. CCC2.4]
MPTSQEDRGDADLDLSPFKVSSRREITALMRALCDQRQLIRLLVEDSGDAAVTSVLHIDEVNGNVILDVPADTSVTRRLLDSENISFETVLERIRILFFATRIEECEYGGLPALRIALPASMIRLQRREFYRVATPLSTPLRCTIQIVDGETVQPVTLSLLNVSGGGITIIDDQHQLDHTVGRIYQGCQIYLPGSTVVVTSLEIRNSVDVRLENGKHTRRLGCLFHDLPKAMLAVIQRYITRLEREQNARNNGIR